MYNPSTLIKVKAKHLNCNIIKRNCVLRLPNIIFNFSLNHFPFVKYYATILAVIK